MSLHLPQAGKRPRVHSTNDNPYQGTTLPSTSIPYNHQNTYYSKKCRDGCYGPPQNHQCYDMTAHDALLSDDTFTDTNTYYEYYQDNGYHSSPKRQQPPSECMFSDESNSSKPPYYEYEEVASRRHSRNASSDRSAKKQIFVGPSGVKDVRKVYPNQECTRLCYETQRCLNENQISTNRRTIPVSGLSSERSPSSLSSEVGSAVVDGCGGRCQTFENVCYYFLQVAFIMGILIGASLCIAGAFLRKSAARNLQVLVYIGILLFFVSSLLLGVQCSARRAARRRRKALKNAKRGAIPLETLPNRVPAYPVGSLAIGSHATGSHPIVTHPVHLPITGANRSLPLTTIPASIQIQSGTSNAILEDQQGVPWWKRKEIV